MKLTTKQIQKIIKEELNNVLYEILIRGKEVDLSSVVHDINYAFRYDKGSEDKKKKLVNILFQAYESIHPNESEYAKRWIDIFYKTYKGFQKVVNADKMLKYRYFHPPPKPEFVPTQKDFSDTSNTPTGITSPDFEYHTPLDKKRNRFRGKDLTGRDLSYKNLENHNFTGTKLTGANLSNAFLNGADLSGAIDLNKVNWGQEWQTAIDYEVDLWDGGSRSSKARYNKKTKWPKGFNPEKYGLRKTT